jgi:hypothetical protein
MGYQGSKGNSGIELRSMSDDTMQKEMFRLWKTNDDEFESQTGEAALKCWNKNCHRIKND